MSQVSVTVNGRTYKLACEDGEETRLLQLAEIVRARMDAFVSQYGQIGDDRLLLMAAMTIADELLDLREQQGAAGMDGTTDDEHDQRVA
jgi:cell division protein ZapA